MKFKKEEFYFVPLGGAEQFGVNLNVYGYDGKWLAVDCGLGFADERFPGVEILLPDPSFLEERRKDLIGMIITHAHEDHIGAVAHLWPGLRCPIYCSAFTAAVLKEKLNENPECSGAKVHVMSPGESISLSPFDVQFIPVSHSIPQTCSLFIQTAIGNVIHSGDWNLDPAPVLGGITEAAPFQKAGEKGVIAYIGDSTNAEVPGVSGSESDVELGLAEVFKEHEGRIAITMFASNIGRIRSICKAAKAVGRKVCVVGRSLHRMVGCARDCGYLADVPEFVSEDELPRIPRNQQVLIVTGSQGETRAQLSRISRGEHPSIKLSPRDVVIFSSRPIPGNEKEIIAVKNNFAASNVRTISPRDTKHCIHISGHPARDEIIRMFGWVKPKCVIPVHGERTMLEAHAELARQCQIPHQIVPNNGSVIRLAPGVPEVLDHIETGLLAVEPGRIIAADHQAITQRRKLQFSGAVHITLVLDKRGAIKSDPHVTTVGLIDPDSDEGVEFEAEIVDEVEAAVDNLSDSDAKNDELSAEAVRIAIRRFVESALKIKPKVTVHLVRT